MAKENPKAAATSSQPDPKPPAQPDSTADRTVSAYVVVKGECGWSTHRIELRAAQLTRENRLRDGDTLGQALMHLRAETIRDAERA